MTDMTRVELKQLMDDLDEMFREKDEVDFNSDEEQELNIRIFSALVQVGRHVVLCLHDMRENSELQSQALVKIAGLIAEKP